MTKGDLAGFALGSISAVAFEPFRSAFYLVAWIVGLVCLFFLLDWISYGFDYDAEKHGTRKHRITATFIAIAASPFALLWYAFDRLKSWLAKRKSGNR